MVVKDVHPRKAEYLILVTLLGRLIVFIALQFLKASSPILVTPYGMFIAFNLVHSRNALLPIHVTLLGIVTLTRF